MRKKKVARFRDESRRLIKMLGRHTESIIRLAAEDRTGEIVRLGGKLRKKMIRYADAQLDVANTSTPFGCLYEQDEAVDDEISELDSESRATLLVRVDLIVNDIEGSVDATEFSTVLTKSLHAEVRKWCEGQPAVDPVAHLVAAVEVEDGNELVDLAPIPDGDEMARVFAAAGRVYFSQLDLYYY